MRVVTQWSVVRLIPTSISPSPPQRRRKTTTSKHCKVSPPETRCTLLYFEGHSIFQCFPPFYRISKQGNQNIHVYPQQQLITIITLSSLAHQWRCAFVDFHTCLHFLHFLSFLPPQACYVVVFVGVQAKRWWVWVVI